MPNHTQENPWEIIHQKTVYENPWIKVTHNDVSHISGKNGVYGVVHFKNLALGVIALDAELNLWLVGQFRFPFNEYTWEIPEGGGALNVNPLQSAQRELLEETGITATHWHKLLELQTSNSATDEKAIIFLAQGLSFQPPKPDWNEQIMVKKIPLSDAYKAVCNGQIKDAISVAAILKTYTLKLEGNLPFH